MTGYGLAGNRKSYTYWLANAFVFFVRDNPVNTPKICTSTSQFLACCVYVSMSVSLACCGEEEWPPHSMLRPAFCSGGSVCQADGQSPG